MAKKVKTAPDPKASRSQTWSLRLWWWIDAFFSPVHSLSARGKQPAAKESPCWINQSCRSGDRLLCAEKLQTLALGNFFRAPQKAKWLCRRKAFLRPPSKVLERTMSEGLNCRLLSERAMRFCRAHTQSAEACSCLRAQIAFYGAHTIIACWGGAALALFFGSFLFFLMSCFPLAAVSERTWAANNACIIYISSLSENGGTLVMPATWFLPHLHGSRDKEKGSNYFFGCIKYRAARGCARIIETHYQSVEILILVDCYISLTVAALLCSRLCDLHTQAVSLNSRQKVI